MNTILKQFSQIANFLKLIILSIVFFVCTELVGQDDYSVLIHQDQEYLSRGKLEIDDNNKTMLFALSNSSNELNFINYDYSKTVNKSIIVKFHDNIPSFSLIRWGLNKYNLTGENAFALTNMNNSSLYLMGLNFSNSSAWSKNIGALVIEGSLDVSENDKKLFLSFGKPPNKIHLEIFDFEGNELKSKRFDFDLEDRVIVSGSVQKIIEINSELLIAISFRVDDPELSGVGGIIKCDKDGNILDQVFFNNVQIKDIDIDNNLSIYLAIASVDENNHTSDGQIIQVNESFEVIWSKNIHADNFIARELLLDVKTDELILIYSTFGSFPVILAKLDLDGSINYQTGLSNYSPDLDIDSDGNVYVTTGFEAQDDGSLDSKLVTAKFSDIEKIDNCPSYNSCLVVTDTNYEIAQVTIETSNIDTLVNVPVEVEENEVQLESYCQDLHPPEALFDIPNTACRNDSLVPSSLNNVLANYVNWELRDPSGNTTLFEELEPTFFFNEIGTYTLKHNIWYLGCGESFEVKIEVFELDSITYEIEESCLAFSPTKIRVEDSGQQFTYDWSTGDTTSAIDIFESGMYSVEISSGGCMDILNFDVEKINLTQKDFLSFIELDSICFEELPYELVPNTIGDNLFSINDELEISDKLIIENFGKYIIKTTYQDCSIEKEFELLEKDCESKLYIPTAFSPNGDGINDEFKYFLNNQELLQIKIYSRWGSLVFESSNPNEFWDGTKNGKYFQSDIFVYLIQFKIGENIETRTGDFVLLR